MIEDPLPAARMRMGRLLADRDQVRRRARATTSVAARQTYRCRRLELVDDVNAAIAAVDSLVGASGSGVTRGLTDRGLPALSLT